MTALPDKTHVEKSLKHETSLISCRFDSTGRFVFAGAQANDIIRWDLAHDSNDSKAVLASHESWVRSFAFSAGGSELISAGYDGRLIWWPAAAAQPRPIRRIDAHAGWIRGLAVSPDHKLLASCGDDLKIKIWNIADGRLVQELTGPHQRHVYQVAFHPQGEQLISGDLVGKFVRWNLKSGSIAQEFTIASLTKYDEGFKADYGGPHCLSFNADGSKLAAGGITNVSNAFAGVGNPLVSVIDWETGKELIGLQLKDKINSTVWGVGWHSEGFIIGATGGQGSGRLVFWKPDQKEEFHQLTLGTQARDLSLHPDGLRVATAHHDGNCRISRMAPKAA